ncbi:MAG TPA: hypothetical protein VGC64_10820 [Pyrinomonadaceae bacterium]
MRTKPQAFLALIGLCLLSACGSDNSTGITGDASGTYNLTSVNGSLPYTYFQDATTTDRITGGNFSLNADGTFTQTLNFDETISGQTTTDASTCNGTFSQNGAIFTFSEVATTDGACGGSYTGRWDGTNQFTFALSGAQLVYVKG